MRTREVYIEDAKNLTGTSGVEVIDLSLAEAISGLQIGLLAFTGAAAIDDEPIQTKISRIDVIDGSDVLYSLTGPQACASGSFDSGEYPQCMYSEYPDQPTSVLIPVMFGRWFGDEEYFVDPSKFKNLQVRITWNIGANYLSGSGRLTIIARVLPGIAGGMGFFMTKELYSFTSVGSGVHHIPLATDHPYRRLMIRAFQAEKGVGEVLTKFKLSGDKDKDVIFELSSEELAAICHDTYGEFNLVKQDVMSDGQTRHLYIDSMLGGYSCNFGQISCGARGVIATINNWGHAKYTVQVITHAGGDAGSVLIYPRVHGSLPEDTIGYSFGGPNVPKDWLNVLAMGALDLHITDAIASSACSVFVQQVRA